MSETRFLAMNAFRPAEERQLERGIDGRPKAMNTEQTCEDSYMLLLPMMMITNFAATRLNAVSVVETKLNKRQANKAGLEHR
jgi:hypothetical protein